MTVKDTEVTSKYCVVLTMPELTATGNYCQPLMRYCHSDAGMLLQYHLVTDSLIRPHKQNKLKIVDLMWHVDASVQICHIDIILIEFGGGLTTKK